MRRFYLKRGEDISGMSGLGKIAEGVEFSNGRVALIWLSEFETTSQYSSITALEKVHTHNGQHDTKVVWIDPKFEKVEEKAKETKTKEIEELVKKEPEAPETEVETETEEEDPEWREPKKDAEDE